MIDFIAIKKQLGDVAEIIEQGSIDNEINKANTENVINALNSIIKQLDQSLKIELVTKELEQQTTISDAFEKNTPNNTLGNIKRTDIRQALSISDRFLYLRELFSNNASLMSDTLDELNKLDSIAEVDKYISNMGWDSENPIVIQFKALIVSKFS